LRLADREGLEALSMRRLGAELGVEAMSIYNHVPNKEALLDGVVEVLFTEMNVFLDGKNSWEDRVREVFRSFRGLAHTHPQIFPLFAVRPSNASKVVRVLPVFLDALRGSGVDVRTSLRAFRTLSSYTIGYALAEIRGFVLEEARGQYRALPGYGDNAAENAPPLEEADRDIEFEFGLDLILMGLREHRTRQ
jgi:AcrR family transcriptional regulator